MKFERSATIVLVPVILFFSGFKTPDNYRLDVEVTNYDQNSSSKIWVSVFEENGFLEKSIQTKSTLAIGQKVVITFDLPPGKYAVSSYHDINQNNKLDRYFIGKPKEPYGFSNNVRPLGPPDFEDCQFILNNSQKTLSIKLIN